MIRYAITNADRFGSEVNEALHGLEADAQRWASEGIEFVQLRERHLPAGVQLTAALALGAIFRTHQPRPRLLINSRADIALAAGADGVHLRSDPDELTPAQVRELFARAGRSSPVVSVSCHSLGEVERARDAGASVILFGPVFEKRVAEELVVTGVGLERLHEAVELAGNTPVLALGGVNANTAVACVEAGARGVAAIRLFS